MSEEDATAEGCEGYRCSDGYDIDPFHDIEPMDVLRRQWDAAYAKRGLGWESNPWVWAVGFERLA